MTRLWFISAPLISHTDWGGFLKTAQVLQAEGHDVTWISGKPLQTYVEQSGLRFQPIRQTGWLWPPPPQPNLSTIPPQEAVKLRYVRALNTWLSEELVLDGTQAIINLADTIGKPDVIVTDPFLSASALAAEALDIPMIVCGWPAQRELNESHLLPIQQSLGAESRQRISRLLMIFGLQGSYFATGPTPSILSPHLHICFFTSRWYSAEAETLLPQNLFVGGTKPAPSGLAPEWLRQIPDGMPLAVITLGSIFTGDLGFFNWAAHAVSQQGLVPVLAIGWNRVEPEEKARLVASLPKGTRLLNWIPFDHVLPRTKLIVHHGGMGTTHQAVLHGIPQIVVPHAADQRIQAKRVAQAKVGLHLTAHDVHQGLLSEATRAILEDEKVGQTARQLANEMVSLGGASRAAKAIISIVSQLSSHGML